MKAVGPLVCPRIDVSAATLALAAGVLVGRPARAEPAAATPTVQATAHARTRPASDRLWAQVGYFGELLFHPGVSVGVDYRVLGNRRGALAVAGHVATYVHVRNSVGLLLYPELVGRLRLGRQRRAYLEAFAGLGYLHAFPHGAVYVVDDAGNVERVRNEGRPAVMPLGGLGVGFATAWVAPYFRVQVFGQYPFNDHMLAHAAVLLGVRGRIPVARRREPDP